MPTTRESKSTLGFYTMGIVALFLVGFFLLVIFGAKSYRDTVTGQSANMDTRATLSYLATTVRANDAVGAISVDGTANEPVLTVRDGTSGYAFRIYLDHGNLIEDYAKADAPLDPTEAQIIGRTETLVVSLSGKVLFVSTDEGSVILTLRSTGGAE